MGWRRDSPGFPGPALTLLCPQVTITVLDENDNSPQFDITSDSAVSVAEDSPVGRRVAVVLARDPDAGSNGQVGRWCHLPRGTFLVLSPPRCPRWGTGHELGATLVA